MQELNSSPTNDSLITKLLNEKKSATEIQERRHAEWDETYQLYRNKVKTNRLTQRQAVNIPLMKETIKTLVSKVDDAPNVKWNEKSGDELKELVYTEIWDDFYKQNKLEWIDIVDKKNVLLYGLSTKFLNITNKGVKVSVLDVYDVAFDPLMNPIDIETARFIVRRNIFKSLRDILADERYEQTGKDALKIFLLTDKGIIQANKNKEDWEKKMERLRSMGVEHSDFPLFAGGDVIVNLTEHYTNVWNTKAKKFERRVVVYADDNIVLLNERLIDLIGIDMYPMVMWSEDPETNDIYPDGVGDLVRTPNKLINVWFSQQAENRTLQNFQMHWYDATVQGYQPQTYEPGPGRMLPAPGDPNKTIKPVAINGLDETFNAINFLTNVVERGTGATAIEKGESGQGTQTLGEVQILVGKATERVVSMQKFYRGSWYELAKKWNALMQSNKFGKYSLYKTGRDGKLYEKIVYDKDWKSEAGYEPTVSSTSEQENDQLKTIQKWGFVLQQNPNNAVLRKIAQERQLGLLDLTPAELKEVQDEEDRMIEEQRKEQMMAMQPQVQPQPQQPQQQQAPQPQMEDLTGELDQLSQLMGA